MFHYCRDHDFEFEFIASFNDWQEIDVKHEHDFHELMENLSMAKEKQDREFEQLEQLVHSKMDHKCLVYSNTPCHFWEDRLPNVVQCLDNTILEDPYAFQD